MTWSTGWIRHSATGKPRWASESSSRPGKSQVWSSSTPCSTRRSLRSFRFSYTKCTFRRPPLDGTRFARASATTAEAPVSSDHGVTYVARHERPITWTYVVRPDSAGPGRDGMDVIALLGLGPPTAMMSSPAPAWNPRTPSGATRITSQTQSFWDLVVEQDPAGAGDDDVGLLLLHVTVSHRAAQVRGAYRKRLTPRSRESRCLRSKRPSSPSTRPATVELRKTGHAISSAGRRVGCGGEP